MRLRPANQQQTKPNAESAQRQAGLIAHFHHPDFHELFLRPRKVILTIDSTNLWLPSFFLLLYYLRPTANYMMKVKTMVTLHRSCYS